MTCARRRKSATDDLMPDWCPVPGLEWLQCLLLDVGTENRLRRDLDAGVRCYCTRPIVP